MLLFFEIAFGICIGCKVCNAFNKDKAQLCPGGVCEVEPVRGVGGNWAQAAVLLPFDRLIGAAKVIVANQRCEVPDFTKALGHEKKWKLHDNCK